MAGNRESAGSRLRARLNHPIIDADGHWLEFGPTVIDELGRIGGELAVQGFRMGGERVRRSLAMSVQERSTHRIAQEAFWGAPTRNTLDRATAMLPRLLYERLLEFGIDFAVLYPTAGLILPRLPQADVRRASCRAFNVFSAELFRDFSDRMTPAAAIPMHTPEEALEELEYVTRVLGMKVVMLGSLIQRPMPEGAERPENFPRLAEWFDTIGLDSEHDYDPVWAKCAELRLSPSFHRGSRGLALRVSPSNFVYNHIGHFAAASEAVCKAIFLGGVTRRFPGLNFAFLEGGVGWACLLYADLIGHWEKRNLEALEDVKPENLDRALLSKLAEEYGNATVVEALRAGRGIGSTSGPETTGRVEHLDDYSACEIAEAEDIRDLFVRPFYFGCEADDRINAWAFNRKFNPFGARLKALFGSDIGHFDVQDMAGVVPEAYELVEEELISESDFRDFTFTNPVRFWGESNPDFFEGTAVAAAAREVLSPPA